MFNVLLMLLGGVAALLAAAVLWVMSGKPSYTKQGNTRVLTSLPSQAYVFGMAIKKSLGAKKVRSVEMPDLCFQQGGVEVRADHVAQYRDICGFDVNKNDTPITYPYLLIFPIQALLLVDPSFPFQAMGLVHLANRIKQFGAIRTGSTVTASARFDKTVVPHAKGYCFNVISEIHSSEGAPLWRCEATYLFRSKNTSLLGGEALPYASKLSESDVAGLTQEKEWSLAGDLSRRYASVSGDFNPIHMYALTAKMFGFPHGCIMHGMYNKAFCAASLMPEVTAQAGKGTDPAVAVAEIYAEFKLPMYLPNKSLLLQKDVAPAQAPEGTACRHARVFELDMSMRKEKNPVPHLKGWCAWN